MKTPWPDGVIGSLWDEKNRLAIHPSSSRAFRIEPQTNLHQILAIDFEIGASSTHRCNLSTTAAFDRWRTSIVTAPVGAVKRHARSFHSCGARHDHDAAAPYPQKLKPGNASLT
jgi:hypothetical protein